MTKRVIIITLLMTLPIALILALEPKSAMTSTDHIEEILGTIFFIDIPIGVCLLHYYYPQLFLARNGKGYSIIPWLMLNLFSCAAVSSGMWLETTFGTYPENGFSVVCAYGLGWMYIWFTMIPIGVLYLLFRLIEKLWKNHD